MVAPAFDPVARAAAWLDAHGFTVTAETGLPELRMLIDLAFVASEAVGAGFDRETIAEALTTAFEDFAG